MSLPLNDAKDIAIAHSHFCGYNSRGFSSGVATSDLLNFVIGNPPLFRSMRRSASAAAFGVHVGNVVLLRSKKQVFRIHAKRGVTFVQNPKIVRYLAVVNHVRKSVGQYLHLRRNVNHSVPHPSLARLPTKPEPATRCVLNVPSETLAKRQMQAVHIIHRAFITAISIARAVLMTAHVRAAELAGRCYAGDSQSVNLRSGFVRVRLADC